MQKISSEIGDLRLKSPILTLFLRQLKNINILKYILSIQTILSEIGDLRLIYRHSNNSVPHKEQFNIDFKLFIVIYNMCYLFNYFYFN